MPTFPNKIAAKCVTCGADVPVRAGWTEGPPWRTKCLACSGKVKEPAKIVVTLEGNDAIIKVQGFLDEKFGVYRAAVEAARFDGQRNVCPMTKFPDVLARLTDTGITLDIAPEVRAAVQAITAQTKLAIEGASARADKIDEILRARGKYLFPFQKEGTGWLAARYGALLADEMGLGKTIQSLAALPDNAAVVVVCPSVAKGVWKREANAWRPEYKVTILSGRGSFRWAEPGEIVVVNYDILPNTIQKTVNGRKADVLPEGLADSCPKDAVLISDEGHMLKNSKAARTKKFRAMSDEVRKRNGRVWIMTATPLLNKAPELWSVLQAAGLANEAFGSWKQFVPMLGGYEGQWGMEWGPIPEPEVVGSRLQRVMLRRLRTEVLPQLPVKTYREVTVEIDAKTAKLCDKALAAMEAKGITLDDLAAAVASTAGGAGFEEMSRARAALATAKMEALLEYVEQYEEQEEPVVVFSAHRAPIDTLGTRPGWAIITGDTAPEERTRIEDAFQRGELKGVGATIKAGGVAITLTRAAHAIFLDQEWTPALNAQAEDRICRIGQDRGCVITHLIAEHALDRRIAALLATKRQVIEASVEQGRVKKDEAVKVVVPEIDFEKLAAEARAEAEAADKARAEAELLAKQREEEFGKLRDEEEKKQRETKEREAKEQKERKARERAEARGWAAPADAPERHVAQTELEKWAHRALLQLSASDPDFAAVQNDKGFNKPDAVVGHWLTAELYSGLTPKQWHLAANLCRKYHGQVGAPPDWEEGEE